MQPRPRTHTMRVEVGKHIQFRIQPLNLPYVRLGQLNYRNLARSQEFQLTCRRRKNHVAHGRPAEFADGD